MPIPRKTAYKHRTAATAMRWGMVAQEGERRRVRKNEARRTAGSRQRITDAQAGSERR
jgi:hypothetical protein